MIVLLYSDIQNTWILDRLSFVRRAVFFMPLKHEKDQRDAI